MLLLCMRSAYSEAMKSKREEPLSYLFLEPKIWIQTRKHRLMSSSLVFFASNSQDDVSTISALTVSEKSLVHSQYNRKRPNDSPEFNKTLGKALLLTTLGQSLRFTHATR